MSDVKLVNFLSFYTKIGDRIKSENYVVGHKIEVGERTVKDRNKRYFPNSKIVWIPGC